MTAGATALARKYGPWAVVTGASDGIGAAFADHLSTQGLSLVLVARRAEVLEQLALRLRRDPRVQCRVLALDLAEPGALEVLVRETADIEVGLLVASAGFGTSGLLLDSDPDAEVAMLRLNCQSVLEQAMHFGRRFAANRRGGLVLMSSLVAFQGTPHAAHYAATKAYIQTLAEGLRAEWKPLGVEVIASAPGPIRSGFAARAGLQMAQALPAEVVARVTMNALGRRTTVRPGWLSKLLGWSLAMLPRWGKTLVIGEVMKGMARVKA